MGSAEGKPAKSRGGAAAAPKRRESGVPAARVLVTRPQLAAICGVSPLRVTKWAAAGLPIAERGRRGREYRYDVAAVMAWRRARELARAKRTLRETTPEISVGSADGVAAGMRFLIYRPGQRGARPQYLGTLRITKVEPKQSAGQIEQSEGDIKTGDTVRDEASFAMRG